MVWFDGFTAQRFNVNGVEIHARFGGNRSKPALLLLHGFPQSHVMWHRVAQQLQHDYFLVMPDLRGYGDSSKPQAKPEHTQASKREMAKDMVDVMTTLNIDQFYLCGHDRGGRVAHRLMLDNTAPDGTSRVKKLCVIDIAPTLDMYNATNMTVSYMEFARAYYHWFHLIQPSPLPENMVHGDWKNYLHAKLGGWGSAGLAYIEPQALADYERCFAQRDTIHSMCEDYRASAGIDLQHDRASRAAGDKIVCDMMVLWGERGVVHRMFKPHELWHAQCSAKVFGKVMAAGHFIPEELPQETANTLSVFFR
jgi:haloacetate dehalogenase